MRHLLVALLAGHGLLHFIGLQWGKAVGLVWGLASLALVAAALLLLAQNPRWWVVAGAALLYSQALIVRHWKAARAGTIVNCLLAVPVLLAATA